MAQNLRKYHVPIYAKKKVFSIFTTKKVTAEKQKLCPFLINFSENSFMSYRVGSTVAKF